MSETLPEPGGEPAEPVEGEETAPEWSGVTQDDWTQTQQLLEQQQQALGQIVQALTPQEQQQQAIDPFAENFQQQLDGYLQQRLAGYDQFQQQVALEQGEAEATRMLGEIVGDQPFLIEGSQQKARELANTYFGTLAQQHGTGPEVAKAALEQAVKDVREWETAVGKAYYERELNQLRGITGAPQEAGAAGQPGATQHLTVAPGGPAGVLRKYTQGL